jgi:O-antigen ligase
VFRLAEPLINRSLSLASPRPGGSGPSVAPVYGFVLVVLLASIVGGLLAALLPLTLSLAAAVILIGLLVIAHFRQLVGRSLAPAGSAAARSVAAEGSIAKLHSLHDSTAAETGLDLEDRSFRLSRGLYYLGVLCIGQLVFRRGASITLSDVFFFFSLVTTLAVIALERRRVEIRLPRLLLLGVFLFAVGGLVSSFGTEVPRQSIIVILKLTYVTAVWFWLGTVVLRRRAHIYAAIALWVASAALNGVGALVQRFQGDVIPGGTVNWGRMTGFTANVNDLGGITAVAIVPALVLLMVLSKRSHAFFLSMAGVILVSMGLVLSGSVGSLAAAAVACALWFGSHPARLQRVLTIAAAGLALVALYSAQSSPDSQSVVQRLTRFGTGSPDDPDRTLGSRVDTYRGAIDRITGNPFVGVGLDPENNQINDHPVHNILIGTWFQTGIIGLAGMVLIFLAGLRSARASIFSARSFEERAVGVGLAASLVAFIVFLMSEPALFTRYGWVAFALLMALRAVQVTAPQPALARRKAILAEPSAV